jgi:transcription elongation factor Elf1
MADEGKLGNGEISHQDAVDYSNSGQQQHPVSHRAEDDDDVQVQPFPNIPQNQSGGGSDEVSKTAQAHVPHVPVIIKEERDGDSPHGDDDQREGLSAFCEALYAAGGPPQGFVVNQANMANLPPDAKPVLAMMAAVNQHQPVVPVKKRRRRRKLKNGELAPGEEHFPYRCDVCEKGLRSLAALKYHERIHSGETPFECQYCGRRFAVTSHLNYHVRVHTGEKPYECSICGRRFAVSNHLRYHERAHTGEKPFRCSVCDKGFTSNFNLKYHEQIHAGIKPHSCDFCGKKYRSKAGLTGHVRFSNIFLNSSYLHLLFLKRTSIRLFIFLSFIRRFLC